jgi:ligand-binding sensor domain-containing protein
MVQPKTLPMRKSLFLPLLLFCISIQAQNLNWESFTTAKAIKAIEPDGEYLWVGTGFFGLSKYHIPTNNVTVYNTLNSGILSNRVQAVAMNDSGDIWMGTTNGGGISKLDSDGNWTNFDLNNSDLPSNDWRSIAVSQQHVWAIGGAAKLAKYDGNNWEIFDTNNSDLPGNPITLHVDGNDNTWVGTNAGLVKITPDNTWTVYDNTNWSPASLAVYSIESDPSGTIFIGSTNNFSVLNNGVWTYYSSSDSDLPPGLIQDIVSNGAGTIWLGADKNLVKFDGTTWEIYNNSNSELPNSQISALYLDATERIWIGTEIRGFVRFDGNTWETLYPSNAQLPENYIEGIAIDANDAKWLATNSKGLARFNNNDTWETYDLANSQISSNWLGDINADETGAIWIATQGSGIDQFDGQAFTNYDDYNSDIPENEVLALFVAPDDVVWVGTGGNGLGAYDGNEWTIYSTLNSGIPGNNIWGISVSSTGIVYVAAGYSGLGILENGNWTNFDDSNSPFSGSTEKIFVDNSGILWASGPQDTYSYDGTSWEPQNIGKSSSFIQGTDGVIWASTNSGLKKRVNSVWVDEINFNDFFSGIGVTDMEFDSANDLWVSTTQGLFKGSGSIFSPLEIASIEYASDILCAGGTTTITIQTEGGFPPYEYSINGGAFQNSNEFAGITAGNYTLTIRDAVGTEVNDVFTLTEPTAINATADVFFYTITVTASGGTAPLMYSINGTDFQASEVFADLANGNYDVTVMDANGCTFVIENVMVVVDGTQNLASEWGLVVMPNPSAGLFRIQMTQAPGGDLQADVLDATGRLLNTQIWTGTNIQQNIDLSNLPQGNYTLRIRSKHGVAAVRLSVIR